MGVLFLYPWWLVIKKHGMIDLLLSFVKIARLYIDKIEYKYENYTKYSDLKLKNEV